MCCRRVAATANQLAQHAPHSPPPPPLAMLRTCGAGAELFWLEPNFRHLDFLQSLLISKTFVDNDEIFLILYRY